MINMDYFHSWWLPYGPRQLTYSPFAKLHHVQLSPPKGIQYASPSNVGTMSFDPNCELLWVGDNYVSMDALKVVDHLG